MSQAGGAQVSDIVRTRSKAPTPKLHPTTNKGVEASSIAGSRMSASTAKDALNVCAGVIDQGARYKAPNVMCKTYQKFMVDLDTTRGLNK
mmetsp:Transcript_55886/g.115750  ORF Transcript_55886/g.115750 Transcript_55886/m.115750 type:complete len:90 (-) Transcript_55886:106-375(-)